MAAQTTKITQRDIKVVAPVGQKKHKTLNNLIKTIKLYLFKGRTAFKIRTRVCATQDNMEGSTRKPGL
jgi:hypothetical protein